MLNPPIINSIAKKRGSWVRAVQQYIWSLQSLGSVPVYNLCWQVQIKKPTTLLFSTLPIRASTIIWTPRARRSVMFWCPTYNANLSVHLLKNTRASISFLTLHSLIGTHAITQDLIHKKRAYSIRTAMAPYSTL